MPKAFVHGVPETSAIWGALVDELETRGIGDITLLTPPGFGAPVLTEDHFVGTEQMYAEVATSLGAKTLTMKGFNHWWMFGEGVAIAADALIAHWDSVTGSA